MGAMLLNRQGRLSPTATRDRHPPPRLLICCVLFHPHAAFSTYFMVWAKLSVRTAHKMLNRSVT